MNRYLKIAYVGLSLIILYFIWEHLPVEEGRDPLLSRLMQFRFLGFVALMLVFFFVFINFLGCKGGKGDN